MTVNEQYQDIALLEPASYTLLKRNGVIEPCSTPILREHLLEVYVNSELTMRLVCVPQYLTELALGRLLSEGIVNSANDVEYILICKYGRSAVIRLSRDIEREEKGANYVEVTPTCCTGNQILNDYFQTGRKMQAITPIPWASSEVFALADRFRDGMPLHGQTWATHSCFLARNGELLFQCEDIGRHNALDKAIGYAMRMEIPLNECIMYSSGRVPTDMVSKVIRAGIPIFCSKAAPTSEAVALAKEYGLTLICGAGSDQMKQFTGPPPTDQLSKQPVGTIKQSQ